MKNEYPAHFLLKTKRLLKSLLRLNFSKEVPGVALYSAKTLSQLINTQLGFARYNVKDHTAHFEGTDLNLIHTICNQFTRYNDAKEEWMEVGFKFELMYASLMKTGYRFYRVHKDGDIVRHLDYCLELTPNKFNLSQDEAYALALLTLCYDIVTVNNFREFDKIKPLISELLLFPVGKYANACATLIEELRRHHAISGITNNNIERSG